MAEIGPSSVRRHSFPANNKWGGCTGMNNDAASKDRAHHELVKRWQLLVGATNEGFSSRPKSTFPATLLGAGALTVYHMVANRPAHIPQSDSLERWTATGAPNTSNPSHETIDAVWVEYTN